MSAAAEARGRPDMYTFRLNPRIYLVRGRRLLWCLALVAGVTLVALGARSMRRGGTVPLDVHLPGEPRYAIILDAGSTGSRVHVFEFRYRPSRRQPYILVDELFKQIRPGLSKFAGRPKEAARSLVQLVEACKHRIPQSYWSRTPVSLKATAGLRLLKADASAKILTEVRHMLSSYPFAVGDDAVEIMDGLDEGIFSWVTLNFLNGQLAEPDHSYGALDLGGGSTQVTFVADAGDKAPRGFVKNFRLGAAAARLYSHSYLGLGLMSARLQILRFTDNRSPCLPANYSGRWEHGGVQYEVIGLGSGYDACRRLAAKVVAGVHAPSGINRRPFYAFSYFFDRAVDLRIINSSDGGVVSLGDLVAASRAACASGRPLATPFLCLDSAYIVSLLADGYKFDNATRFVMRKKVHNVELGWALGAVFDVFYNHHGKLATTHATVANLSG